MKTIVTILFCFFGAAAEAAITQTFTTTNVPSETTNQIWLRSAEVASESATNWTSARGSHGFSANLMNMYSFWKALNVYQHKPRIMWLGDSTGNDSLFAFRQFFRSNFVYGFQESGLFIGPLVNNSYQDQTNNGTGTPPIGVFSLANGTVGFDPVWWSTEYVMSNQVNIIQTFGNGSPASTNSTAYARGNRLQFWYLAHSGRGTVQVETSTDSVNWATNMTVDTSTGTAGIRVTNTPLALGNYAMRVRLTVLGTENRAIYLWPVIEDTTTPSAEFFDGHAPGQTLSTLLAMGTNNIAYFLTNFNPDIIFYEQTKPTTGYGDWTNVAPIFRLYSTNSDVVLIQAQIDLDPPTIVDPVNGQPFQLYITRQVALSNDWPFVDLMTIFDSWTNVIIPQQFTNGGQGGIHFGPLGFSHVGNVVLQELGIPSMVMQAGLFQPGGPKTTPSTAFDPSQIAGLKYRYDVNSTNLNNGNFISSLPDLSGNGFTLIASGGTGAYFTNNSALLNGYPWFETGGNVAYNASYGTHFAQTNTFFFVIRMRTTNATQIFMGGTNGNNEAVWTTGIGNSPDVFYTVNSNQFYILEVSFQGAGSYIKTNGVTCATGTATTSALEGLTIGANNGNGNKADIGLAYFLGYNALLSQQQDNSVTDWLQNRFGVFPQTITGGRVVQAGRTKLAAGTIQIFTSFASNTNIISVSPFNASGNGISGFLSYSNIVEGNSFTVYSSSTNDTSEVIYAIFSR